MLNYKVNDKFNALPLDKFELKGKMADDYNRFFCGRVLSDYAKTVVYKETEDAFRNQVDGEKYETPVCDYASAGNVETEEKELFSVFF